MSKKPAFSLSDLQSTAKSLQTVESSEKKATSKAVDADNEDATEALGTYIYIDSMIYIIIRFCHFRGNLFEI